MVCWEACPPPVKSGPVDFSEACFSVALQPNAKFLLSYVDRCEYTTQLLWRTADRCRLSWRPVDTCTHQLNSSQRPRIIEFVLKDAVADVTDCP